VPDDGALAPRIEERLQGLLGTLLRQEAGVLVEAVGGGWVTESWQQGSNQLR
jgi:hypothetical protein